MMKKIEQLKRDIELDIEDAQIKKKVSLAVNEEKIGMLKMFKHMLIALEDDLKKERKQNKKSETAIDFEEMSTMEDFKALKEGDIILVKWDDSFVNRHRDTEKVMLYKIYEVKLKQNEIICQFKDNHYFNYRLYLDPDGNQSNAEHVLKIKTEKE